MKNIVRLNAEDNLGGILDIQVARASDIASMEDPLDGIVYGNITFNPGKGFYSWNATHETGEVDSSSKITKEGSTKSNRLPFNIPKDRPDLRSMFLAAEEGGEFVVLFKYASGKQRLFGHKYAPVRFKFNHSSGARHDDYNGYECEFYFDGPDNMFEYGGSGTSAPAGAPPVIININGVFFQSVPAGTTVNFDTDFEFDFQIVGT